MPVSTRSRGAHHVSIVEEGYPKRSHPVIRRLTRAASNIEVRNIINLEEEVLGKLKNLERRSLGGKNFLSKFAPSYPRRTRR